MSTRNASKMKHLSLSALLAIAAPLSWGENVFYCVEEQRYQLDQDETSGSYSMSRWEGEKYTIKYEAETDRLLLTTRFDIDGPAPLRCIRCDASGLKAQDSAYLFQLRPSGRFFLASVTLFGTDMSTGTCTKF